MKSSARLHDFGLLAIRVLLGIGIMTHGGPKIFKTGIDSFAGRVGQLDDPLNLLKTYPYFFAWAAALSEFLGGICVAAGFATRIAAFLILCTMSVAFFIRHAADPFSAKELAFTYGALALGVTLLGPGPYSLDRYVWGRGGGSRGGHGTGKKRDE